jgi:hypothetical protein
MVIICVFYYNIIRSNKFKYGEMPYTTSTASSSCTYKFKCSEMTYTTATASSSCTYNNESRSSELTSNKIFLNFINKNKIGYYCN